jgi:UDP-N-acetylglucosamine diphosphorylase / glucose-1-phosphate thymidylyltransferase / UDP-N-acetylgalactosamine diphosphorylase / glucosamine-1-phosphate N-acetyltransferase / galactosamine-1-phosphate N-acetyltransferase
MHVVIFEGSRWHTFAPLSLSRPVFALASGACSLLEKHIRHLRPTRLTLWVRPALADYCRREIAPRLEIPVTVNEPLDEQTALLVSGRTLHFSRFEHTEEQCVIVEEENLIRKAIVRAPGLTYDDAMNRTAKWMKLFDLPRMDEQARMADYVWDLINWNEESLVEDFVAMGELPSTKPAGPYHMVHDANVWIAQQVKLEPGVVLDGSRGPIMLDTGCSIGANSVLKGPCYVGMHAEVKPLCVIHAGTTIGPGCKVGGEIKNSILTANTNKAHEGYLGDSYLGEWVNLGAGTTTSNLKNTYGPIKMRIGTREFETGRRNLGSLIGDHSKTAIGTRLMTGSYIGYSSMIATSALLPSFIPSFRFITDRGSQEYRLEKIIEVMKAVYGRRNKVPQAADEEMLRYAREAAREVEA